MGIVKEFKVFAMLGNVVDMAVGIIIGGAFDKIDQREYEIRKDQIQRMSLLE